MPLLWCRAVFTGSPDPPHVQPVIFAGLLRVLRPVPRLLPPLALPAELARRSATLALLLCWLCVHPALCVPCHAASSASLSAQPPQPRHRAGAGCRCRAQEGPGPAARGGRGPRGWGRVLKGAPPCRNLRPVAVASGRCWHGFSPYYFCSDIFQGSGKRVA